MVLGQPQPFLPAHWMLIPANDSAADAVKAAGHRTDSALTKLAGKACGNLSRIAAFSLSPPKLWICKAIFERRQVDWNHGIEEAIELVSFFDDQLVQRFRKNG